MVGSDGKLPLPWLGRPLQQALGIRRSHALLLHGPRGVGQWELALTVAQALLCEAGSPDDPRPPCGVCASCRLVQVHSHPDLLVLLPDALRGSLGWEINDAEGDGTASDKASKAKPSKEIKVDAVRAAVVFAQTTSARARAKVVVVHPAERMNGVAANTLLKTLEEPPGQARFVLSCAAPDTLLPTIRSRCQALPLCLPARDDSVPWLRAQGVAQPEVLLAAAGDQPQEVLEWTAIGLDAALWQRLPELIAAGQSTALAAWPLPRLLDAMQKLCHDLMCLAAGASPRYYEARVLGTPPGFAELSAWARDLQQLARHAEHPWNAGLMTDAIVQRARRAVAGATAPHTATKSHSVHSRA